MLYDVGLSAALEHLASRMEKRHNLRVDVSTVGCEPPIPEGTRTFVFQCVRESLINVIKHAGVGEAEVTLEFRPGSLRATVTDKGRGFDAALLDTKGISAEHFGLFSVRERAAVLGGSLSVDSAADHGTRFVLTMPLPVAE